MWILHRYKCLTGILTYLHPDIAAIWNSRRHATSINLVSCLSVGQVNWDSTFPTRSLSVSSTAQSLRVLEPSLLRRMKEQAQQRVAVGPAGALDEDAAEFHRNLQDASLLLLVNLARLQCYVGSILEI